MSEGPSPPASVTGDGLSDWISLQVEAMASAWTRGEELTAAQLIERNPGLGREAAIRLVFEEIGLARDLGRPIDSQEVLARYPEWRGELEILLECDELLRGPPPIVFPEVGESLGDFRIVGELGRGGAGRTYLAVQPSLASRPVALKVVPAANDEHLSLARLQHTYIVPLYSEHEMIDLGLRALCMPYLGGASLDRVLEKLGGIAPEDRSGTDFSRALSGLESQHEVAVAEGPSVWSSLAGASYTQAICWIASCLAEGLQYAHERRLIHLDIKPSNVLIAGDGQPMLLDFHLARRPIEPGERAQGRLGGTPGWMAPEQERVMLAIANGELILDRIDGRADIYALGLLIYEALGGSRRRDKKSPRPPLADLNVEVSPGLSDIVARCLRDDPVERYPDPASLADDLRRHLQDRPLVHVPNRSPTERWAKWRRRHPHSLSRTIAWCLAAPAILGLVGFGAWFFWARQDEVWESLSRARAEQLAGRFDDAILDFTRAETLATWSLDRSVTPEQIGVELKDCRNEANYRLTRQRLHEIADRLRYQTVLSGSEDSGPTLLQKVPNIWERREALLESARQWDSRREQLALKADLRQIVLAWVGLQLQAQEPGADAARELAEIIAEAERLLGASPSLAQLRADLDGAEPVGTAVAGADGEPPAPDDVVDLGLSLLRSGDYGEAARAFAEVIEARPDGFWPNFYQAVCQYHLGRPEEAIAYFRTSLALAPDSAPCYYNRAVARESLRDDAGALRDYDRALGLDAAMVSALVNRGRLYRRLGQDVEAEADFERALELAETPELRSQILLNLRRRPAPDPR